MHRDSLRNPVPCAKPRRFRNIDLGFWRQTHSSRCIRRSTTTLSLSSSVLSQSNRNTMSSGAFMSPYIRLRLTSARLLMFGLFCCTSEPAGCPSRGDEVTEPDRPVTAITIFFPTVECQNVATMLGRWFVRGKNSSLDRIITKLSSLRKVRVGNCCRQFSKLPSPQDFPSLLGPNIDSIILPLPQAWPAA